MRGIAALVGGVVVGGLAVVGCAGDEGASAATPASTHSASSSSPGSTPPNDPPADVERAPVRTITVSGEGKVTVQPDTVHVQMGVLVNGATAQDVLAQANEKAAALISAVKALGIADEDIQTSGISIHPEYEPNSPTVVGFQASNNLNVTIRDIDRAGEIIDGGAAFAGEAITIGGIWFSVGDPEAVLSAARAAAVDNAAKRADEFASAAGADVGTVISISEVDLDEPRPIYYEAASDRAQTSVPIEAGTQDLSVHVTVVFELQPG
jgi:uncharacterized protein YggE